MSRRPVRARASQPPDGNGLVEEETGDTLDEELVEEDLSGERATTPVDEPEAMDLEPDTDPHMNAADTARVAGGDDDRTLPRVPAREAVLAAAGRYESFDSGVPARLPAKDAPARVDPASERESVVIVRRAHIISDMPPPPRPTGVASGASPAPVATSGAPLQLPSLPVPSALAVHALPTPPPVPSAPALNALPTPPPVPVVSTPRVPPPPPVSLPSASSNEQAARAPAVAAPVVPKADEVEVEIDMADVGGAPVPTRDDEPTTVLLHEAGEVVEPVASPARRSGTPPPPPETKGAKKPPPPPRPSRAEDPIAAISPAPVTPAAPASVSGPAPGGQPRVRQWWERFFSDDYLMSVLPPTPAQIARQVDFLESSLGLPRGGTVLDVGCGLGLHARELAQRGYLVVGLDLSLPMITRAAEEAQQRNLRINFLHTDIREIQFDGAFDGVICLGTTFGFFDDDSNRDVLARLYQALRPGGRILLDVVNRDHVINSQPNLVWFQGEDCVCMEESDFNYFNSRLIVKRTMMQENGQQSEAEYSVRLYALHELGQLMQQMGFRVMEVSGQEATRGTFFGTHSQRILMLAERRPAQRMSTVLGAPERRTSEAPAPPPPKREG